MVAARPAPENRRVHTLNPGLQALLATVHTRAHAPVWLVGGALRDLLRGREPHDLDFAVESDARAVARRLADSLGADVFDLDEGRQQSRVLVADGMVQAIDFTGLPQGLEADLHRRDFTINALAAEVGPDGTLSPVIDVHRGLVDLDASRLRMTSETALTSDPLRFLRAVRIAIEHGFEIEPATAEAIRRHAPLLPNAAAERQRDELVRIFETHRSARAVRLLDSLGLLAQVLPELLPAKGVEQPANHHYYDVFDHSVECLANLDAMLSRGEPLDTRHERMRAVFRWGLEGYPLDEYLEGRSGAYSRRVLLKLAGLLHDVSKPETRTLEADGRIRFFGHPEKGARKAELICRRLRFGTRETRFVSLLVDNHLRPTMLSQDRSKPPSRRALFRFFRDLDDAAQSCLFLYLGDGSAAAGPRLTEDGWKRMVSYVAYLLAEHARVQVVFEPAHRLVTGNDLIETLGLAPGPRLGEVLRAIEEAIAAEEVSSRDEAIDYARRLMAGGGAKSAGDTPDDRQPGVGLG